MLVILVQFIVALMIRLGWHKYTTGIIYAMNPYVMSIFILIQLYMSGTVYLPFILGFFLVEIVYYPSKYINKKEIAEELLLALIKLMPEKKEV